MIRILHRLWSIWFYILFIGTYLLLFPFFVLLLSFNKKWMHDLAHHLNTFWGYCITWPVLIFIRTHNKKYLKRGQTYIYCPNHSSYLDIPVMNVALNRSFRYIGKAELGKIPLFGFMYNRLYITVDRSSKISSFRSLIKSKEKLQEGTSMLIFPEGTIPDKKNVILSRFKDGAFRLAAETGLPVVPITVNGTHDAMPDNKKFLIRPQIIDVWIHEPIVMQGEGAEVVIGEKTREAILSKLKGHSHED